MLSICMKKRLCLKRLVSGTNMLVVVKGNPLNSSCQVVGLDILSPRHPKLYDLVINRLGMKLSQPDKVGIMNLF